MAELRQLDAGAWFGSEYAGQRVPSLDEVLDWARARDTMVDIEIKNAPIYYLGIEEAVVRCLEHHAMSERSIVISFDHAAVKRVKELDSRVATGVLYAGRPVDGGVGLAREARRRRVAAALGVRNSSGCRSAHTEQALAVAPWVSSDPRVLREA